MNANQTNIILISIDALRADHLSSLGHHRQTSPVLDSVAEKCVSFTTAFSPSSHTREAIPALLSGRYPDEAVNEKYTLATETIASRLEQVGFRTGGFHSNPFVSRAFGFDDGFDVFNDDLYLGQNKLIAFAQRAYDKLRNRHYARADEINKRSLNWVDSLDEGPFFLWNHYMDVHGPYAPPNQYRRFTDNSISDKKAQKIYQRSIKSPDSITDEQQDLLIDLYDSEIRYLDEHLGNLFEELENRDLFSNSMVIITSDHGEVFGEHGYYEHPRYPYRELLHVPLFISTPNNRQIIYDDPVSTLDIVPTILEECSISDRSLDGVPLQSRWKTPDSCNDEYRFGQASTENDDGHWVRRYGIHSSNGGEIIEYTLSEHSGKTLIWSNNSTTELSNRLSEHALNRLESSSQRYQKKSTTEEDDDTSNEIEDRLEALGYMDR